MYTLLIDTHLNNVILVLYKNGRVIAKEDIESKKGHSEVLMPMIYLILNENNLNPKDLNEIFVVNGPGSFTGVRLGVTVAKTLAYTLTIPIKVMSSLLLKAINIKGTKTVAISDRNGHFLATFDENNDLIDDYKYISNKDLNDTIVIIEVEKLDYELIYEFAKKIPSTNPHAVKPLYVKKIEVEK